MRLQGSRQALRWPSRAAALLVARLALGPQRDHPREELVELLWPGVAGEVGRNRLRNALSVLRSGLDLNAGAGAPTLFDADRHALRLRPGVLQCDVHEFEQLLRRGSTAQALQTYGGELMPGFYEDWVLDARSHLSALHERAQAQFDAEQVRPAASAQALPAHWTRLFGIEHSATRLRALVTGGRLVSIVGPGGCGKTRLSIEVARALCEAPDWPADDALRGPRFELVAFVSLVDCRSAPRALEELARALGTPASQPLQGLRAALTGRSVLLVLDNLEQMAPDAAELLVPLLQSLPQLHVLLTSRRRLGLEGEQVFLLGGLGFPEPSAKADEVARAPSVALFADRAHAAHPEFQLGESELPAVAQLVRLLDGMPLAIELAATRLRGGGTQQLLQRLQASPATPLIDELARGRCGTHERDRHGSMRRVMDWSWQQLPQDQAALVQAMTALCAPARVETIAAAAGIGHARADALLQELADASLVTTSVTRDGLRRHGLLQPVREYAAERWTHAAAQAARARLRQWWIEQGPLLLEDGPVSFEPELAHVHAAFAGAVADGAPEQALRMAVALKRYWVRDTLEPLPATAMQALDACAADSTEDGLRSEACELLAMSYGTAGSAVEGLRCAEMALLCARSPSQKSLALCRRAWLRLLSGQHRPADACDLDEACALALRSGDTVALAMARRMQAMVQINIHCDFARAERLVHETQTLWEQLGDTRNARRRLLDRATCWAWLGRNEEAAAALLDCANEALRDGDFQTSAMSAWQLGRVLLRLRRWSPAAEAFRRCLRESWQRHNAMSLAYALLHLPDALVMDGQAELAARLQGFAVPHWERMYGPINVIEAGEMRRTRRLLRLALGAGRVEALRISGAGANLADVIRLVLGPRDATAVQATAEGGFGEGGPRGARTVTPADVTPVSK